MVAILGKFNSFKKGIHFPRLLTITSIIQPLRNFIKAIEYKEGYQIRFLSLRYTPKLIGYTVAIPGSGREHAGEKYPQNFAYIYILFTRRPRTANALAWAIITIAFKLALTLIHIKCENMSRHMIKQLSQKDHYVEVPSSTCLEPPYILSVAQLSVCARSRARRPRHIFRNIKRQEAIKGRIIFEKSEEFWLITFEDPKQPTGRGPRPSITTYTIQDEVNRIHQDLVSKH